MRNFVMFKSANNLKRAGLPQNSMAVYEIRNKLIHNSTEVFIMPGHEHKFCSAFTFSELEQYLPIDTILRKNSKGFLAEYKAISAQHVNAAEAASELILKLIKKGAIKL